MTSAPGIPLQLSALPALTIEAQQLVELYTARQPPYRRERREVHLQEGDSPLIREFWRILGWAPALKKCFLDEPEIALGVERVRKRLRQCQEDEEDFPLTEASLPSRFRLVCADTDTPGFIITDESTGAADPPLLSFLPDINAIEPTYPSYLNWCANGVICGALNSWYNTSLKLSDVTAIQKSVAPFPVLSPATRQINSDLWLAPQSPTLAGPSEWIQFSGSRFDVLIEWLFEHDPGAIDDNGLPGKVIGRPGSLALHPQGSNRLRIRPGLKAGVHYHVGWIADCAVLVKERSHLTEIAVNPRHVAQVEAALATIAAP